MPTVLDLIPPHVATDFVRELFTTSHTGLGLEKFLPYRTQGDIRVKVRTSTRTVVPALYRSYDSETPVGKRPAAVSVAEWNLPPLGTKLKLDEETQHMLLVGGASDPMIDQLFNDLETITRGVVATLEVARGQMIQGNSTGTALALDTETGKTIDVAWATPASHRPTATVLWDASSGTPTPLADEIAWDTTLKTDQLGFGITVVTIGSTKIMALLQKSGDYIGAFYGAGNNAPGMLNPAQVNAVRATWGLSPLEVNDEIIAGARVLADNKIYKIPTDFGNTLMGPTLEARNLGAGGNPRLAGIDVPGLVGVIQEDGDPAVIWTKVAAVGAPSLNDANRHFSATVAASS